MQSRQKQSQNFNGINFSTEKKRDTYHIDPCQQNYRNIPTSRHNKRGKLFNLASMLHYARQLAL
jgi:hypothetical protein